jgi:16S rRNA A1518/A1519 N6-dimethyltransferase RsmA/KsgA/DIM1 with predicted DNA glycosylase/AP lyase activity
LAKALRIARGQHMLTSAEILDRFVRSCDLTSEMAVLEIGAGRGTITQKLAQSSRYVRSFEIDRRLYEEAKSLLKGYSNVDLVFGDAFSAAVENKFDRCVTSLPYSQSLRFGRWLAINSSMFSSTVAIVQDEFARKIMSPAGESTYRAISVILQSCFDVQELFAVPCNSFDPPPRVGSTAIRLLPRKIHLAFDRKRIKLMDLLFSFRGRLFSSALKKIAPTVDEDSIPKEIRDKRIERLSTYEFQMIISRLGDLSQT